jgi:hypothetical protein
VAYFNLLPHIHLANNNASHLSDQPGDPSARQQERAGEAVQSPAFFQSACSEAKGPLSAAVSLSSSRLNSKQKKQKCLPVARAGGGVSG